VQFFNRNYSLSSTDFTSKRNDIKNKLDFEKNDDNNSSSNGKLINKDKNLINTNNDIINNLGSGNNQYCTVPNFQLQQQNKQCCLSQKNIMKHDQIIFQKPERNLDSIMGWNEKIKLAEDETKKVLKNKKVPKDDNAYLDNNNTNSKTNYNYKIENKIYNKISSNDDDFKNIYNNNSYQLNTNESNKNNLLESETPARANLVKRSSTKNMKTEKGNLKYITNTGILNQITSNNEEDTYQKRKISENNVNNATTKDNIAVKIKYLPENKELKFKHLNIEIKDPPLNPNNPESENNPNENTQHSNFYEVYKIKTKKKKKKCLNNISLDSEITDPLNLNEMQISQPTNSNKLFKKLKVKYLINDNFKHNNNNNHNQNAIFNENNLTTNNNNNINSDHHIIKVEGESNMNIQIINNNNNNNDFEVLTRMHEIRTIDELKPSTIKIKTIEKLAAIVGMIGVKYKQSDFDGGLYLPWECVSIAEPDFNKYIVNIEERIKLIKLCQKAFIKTYPDVVKRTNSSNHDPIVCWASGVQIVALNLQKTDDDMILINKIFFKLNGGSKSGYILKPELLRNPNCDDLVKRMCSKVAFKIKFKVLSGFHLHMCFPEKNKIKGLYVEVSLRSAYSDKSDNKKLVTNTIENNFLHPIWVSSSVQFEVYDPDLSFIIIKVFSKKKTVIARSVIPIKFMNMGIRVVDLYDNYCSKFENSFLIVKCNKIFVDK